jgi:predicted membrane chloride channel (bestrophin family)
VLWLSFLPFSLWDRLSWGVVPATAIIAYLLLGIDEIAIQLVGGWVGATHREAT